MRPVQPQSLILASSSPQRARLMRDAGYEFSIVHPRVEEPEERHPHVEASLHAESLAYFKARSVAPTNVNNTILAADTIAYIDDEVIGKPEDEADARRILRRLSGTTHEVITGVALLRASDGHRLMQHAASRIRMRRLSDEMIDEYLQGGEWRGKAGAYGIQDQGDKFVEEIEGSFSNVVGLPTELLARMFSVWK